MFANHEFFDKYKSINSQVEIANGKTVPIVGSGIVGLKNVHGIVFQLKAVHVPDLVHPLISWGRLWDKQCDFICKAPGEFEVVDNVT